MAKIRQTIAAQPRISRRRLSQRICKWMNWRSPNGKLREVSCRKALVELHRRKLIELPDCESMPFVPAGRDPRNFLRFLLWIVLLPNWVRWN